MAIKTENTGVIPVDCYCPRMLKHFSKKTSNKHYTPEGGDVVFYDWNRNKVPDHVGMIESVSGNSVTAIEGNYSDSVKRRTFKKGYSKLLSYGLPNYTINNMVSYTAPEPADDEADSVIKAASVSGEDIRTACDMILAAEPVEAEPMEEPAEEAIEAESAEEPGADPAAEEEPVEEQAEAEAFAPEADTAEAEPVTEAEPATDVEVAEKIIDYIQEETPAENESAEESEFNAFLVYGICDEMDIDACVVTVTEADGTERSYNEVVLDGEMYILNATEDGGVLEKYTPEEIN